MTINVTLVSGFLGSGKTTLINHVLQDPQLDKESVVVIENEVGDVNIDHRLMLETTEQIYELNQGCICCNLRQDLLYVFDKLAKLYQEGDWNLQDIIIETTGIADPRPIIQTVRTMAGADQLYAMDSVYTVVDCENYEFYLNHYPEASAQIVFADKIYLSKWEADNLEDIKSHLRKLNPFAEFELIDLDQKLSAKSFLGQKHFNSSNHDRLLADQEKMAEVKADHSQACHHTETGDHDHNHDHHHDHHDHDHQHDIESLYLETEVLLAPSYVQMFLDWLLMTQMESLYRYKGFIRLKGREDSLILQGVGMNYHLEFSDRIQADKTELVLIGRHLETSAIKDAFHDLIGFSNQANQEVKGAK